MNDRLMQSLQRAAGIVLLGIGAGLAANQISPRGLPLIALTKPAATAQEFIPLDQAKQLWDSGASLFLDAREPDDYAAGHIGNALNLPVLSFAQHFPGIAPMLAPDSSLILYCDGQECDLSHRLAEILRQQGYTNVQILFNGWTAWRQAGLPASSGGPP
jgi:rhodanese-related sulfurtransferase